ncbi:efflux RND transporter periplasmic adaptor subunit [Flavobacterium selenitireducens]|uniref:efflux RND transporter periplasmic adaptor subunit n=1 Tax=Flavobacterium selenitireducens TaxID=2722704 RepID=UPI00168A5E49|nr:efflux RND transporter periplasmic adaptor subunit [Flavobacterium selenitireducens]MBD3582271.1 efflux RND transporter periplasmic adaptor subunit [Flavobacterium selenitireducens]
MKNNRIVSILLLGFAIGCGTKEEEKKAAPDAAPVLETVSLAKEKMSTEMRIPAELTGMKQVDLFAKVTSFVKELKVDIGSEVKQGQLLVSLEAPEISSQLSAAESRLKSQEAVYLSSKATYNRLLETSKVEGTIAKNDLEIAEARKNADFANYQAAKASYSEVTNIRGYLQIRAPFDGVVSARNVNLGAYVGPSSGSLPLLSIQQQDKLRLSVFVPEQYSGYLKTGSALTFNVKSLPGQEFDAKISRMSGALDARLRSERVEMDVNNNSKKLKPGMIAEVLLPLNAPDSTVVVPKSAVVTSSEGIYVLIVENGKTKRVPVTKGRELEERVEIFGDLPEKGQVVRIGSEEIKDGTPVK